MTNEECGWCAGVISCFGMFKLSDTEQPRIELILRTMKHTGMIEKMSKLVGIKMKKKKSGYEVIISGDELSMFWAMIFRSVTSERIIEYDAMIHEQKKRWDAYADKLEYQAERAAAPRSTPDSIRHREEALYHNQDPAVQVINEGFVEAEMAVQYDLDQAQRARERATAQMTQGQIVRHKRKKD